MKSIAGDLATGVDASSTLTGRGPFAWLAPTFLRGGRLRNGSRRGGAAIDRRGRFRPPAPREIPPHCAPRPLPGQTTNPLHRHRPPERRVGRPSNVRLIPEAP